jgi:hypothetical protein
MEHQKFLVFFATKTTKYGIAGFIITLLGIYSVYFLLYEELIGAPFKVLYSPELTRNYHGALALISSLVAWRLISNLPFIAFNSLKEADGAYKLVVVYLIAAGLIIYTGSVIAHNFALTYLHGMP